jgi:hypothetical protein
MRTVVSPQEVAHLFAQQSQQEAKNSGRSFYFYGTNIYSYGSHFCIAKFVDRSTLLFTERSYSNSTAKHINTVRHATSHIDKIYCAYPTGSHEQNYHYWLNEAEDIASKLKNARKPEIYLSQLANVKYKVDRYKQYFKIDMPITLEKALSIMNKTEVTEYLESKQKILDAEAKRKAKEQSKQHAVELKKWRAFEKQSLYLRDGFDYIRRDDEKFQTSQGVNVPIEIGLRLYENIRSAQVGDKFLSYTVNEVTKNHIGIGCHKITFKEIDNIVKS